MSAPTTKTLTIGGEVQIPAEYAELFREINIQQAGEGTWQKIADSWRKEIRIAAAVAGISDEEMIDKMLIDTRTANMGSVHSDPGASDTVIEGTPLS